MTSGVAVPLDSVVKMHPGSVACDLEGEIVILNCVSGVYFGLNSVGGTVWNYIQSERSVEEIVLHLLAQYKVDRARCESEVFTLLKKMADQGLVTFRTQ